MTWRFLVPLFLGFALSLIAGAMLDASAPERPAEREISPEERRALLEKFVDEFVTIRPGEGAFPESFIMGSDNGPPWERPAHRVKLDYTFSIARYEVPQNLYEAVMGTNPSRWKGPRNAVEMVSFRDAQQFCVRITRMLQEEGLIGDDEEIRLPTEAEWEYCCRAGSTTEYSFGDKATREGDVAPKASLLDAYAWHTGNAAGNDPPVGALKPNAWGLFDMHGYLWEYVEDAWHASYEGAPDDGRGWESGRSHVLRVMRGGSWRDHYRHLRSSARWPIPDHALSDAVGFRCVRAARRTGQSSR